MRNKSRLAGLFVALFVALSAFAFTGTPAQATKPGGDDERKPAVCHPVEGRGETGNGWNIISPDKASSHIDEDTGAGKHTRKDGRTDVYAVDGKCPGPEIPEWFEPTYPPFTVPECQEYLIDKQVSTWDADTGTWSAWTDWGADPVADDGRAKTGHHGGQHKKDGDRHFAYIVILGDPITTGECAPPTKDDEVTYGDWTGEPKCDETTYVQTRTVTTIKFTWNGEGFDASDPIETTETRTVQVEKVEPCPTTPTTEPPVTTVPPTTQPSTTEPPATTTPPVTEPPATVPPQTIPSECYQFDGTRLPLGQFELKDVGDQTITGSHSISGIPCGPIVATDIPPTPTQPTGPTSLPSTGASSWTIFLIGLASVTLGGLVLALTRRKATI